MAHRVAGRQRSRDDRRPEHESEDDEGANINSTATGGGVAEMLATLIGYARGADLEADWLVITGDPDFFAVDKRIHNGLYGAPGDGGQLGAREREFYERTTRANVDLVREEVRTGDVVIVHDPQPAGLIGPLVERGVHVVWRCHVGHDDANEWTERGWAFVRPYVNLADAHVFSRKSFAPPWIDRARIWAIPPSIDPFTPKNAELGLREVLELLSAVGLVAPDGVQPDHRVRHPAEVVREGPPPDAVTPLVVQVSRWDRMKDMVGVLEGFVRHLEGARAHLVLAGPSVRRAPDAASPRRVAVRRVVVLGSPGDSPGPTDHKHTTRTISHPD